METPQTPPAGAPSPRYRREGAAYLIEIHLHDLRGLYNSLDPAPFLEKDLDDEAEAYITEAVEEFPLQTPLKLIFHLPPAALATDAARAAPDAIRNYFDYRAAHARRARRQLLRRGRLSLLIGLAFLVACIGARELLVTSPSGPLVQILREGLLISGWVAMWRPLQIYLYDWWPLERLRRVRSKIRDMPMELRAHTGGVQAPAPLR